MLQYSPIRSPIPADRQALLKVVAQQIKAYRSGLPLIPPGRSPGGPSQPADMELKFQVWGMQYGSRSADVLNSFEAVADLFQQDGIEGRLLILGEPGMGKTHTLVAVGHILLQRARQSGAPVPVLIDLSGWRGETLRNWLIDYLWEEYRMAKSVAEEWIDIPQLTFLFDGFDHLSAQQQRGCAHAIETLLRTSPNQTAVLCCRRKVVEESGITFNYFNSGINILPLAAQQVKDFTTVLNRSDLWQGIKASKSLQLLARVPLHLAMLGVMFQGQTIQNRHDLFDTFFNHQFSQAKISPQSDQVPLQWLARQLDTRSRTFRLDRLEPSWLPSSRRVLYRLLMVVLLALIYGLIAGNLVLGAALGLVASQIDVEHFPRYRLSLATASWRSLGVMAVASSLAALVFGLLVGGLVALPLSRFGGALSAFGIASSVGAIVGWCIALGILLWGGVQGSIQIRTAANQDVVNAMRNCTILIGLLGGVIVLLLVLPALITNQPPLTLLNGQRLRLLVVGGLGAILWLSYGLQQAILRLLLLANKTGGLPAMERSFLRRLVASGVLRSVGGGFSFCHDSVRNALAQRELQPLDNRSVESSDQEATAPTR